MTQEEEIGATTIAPILIGVVCDEEKSCDQACLIGRAAKTPVPPLARTPCGTLSCAVRAG